MLADPKAPERLTIGPRVYLLRRPNVSERAQWRHACVAAGARRYDALDLLGAMRDGVNRIMVESDPAVREAILAKIETHRANIQSFRDSQASGLYRAAEDASDDDKKEMLQRLSDDLAKTAVSDRALANVSAEVRTGYAAYAAMLADNAVYYELAGIEAARMFLIGWEAAADAKNDPFPEPLVRSENGLSEASFAFIPEGDLPAIALKLEDMTRVSETQRKNSNSPAPAPSAGKNSAA